MPGTITCGVCGERYSSASETCPRCGFHPGMGAGTGVTTGAPASTDASGQAEVPVSINVPTEVGPSFKVVRLLVAVIAVAAVGVGGLIAFSVADRASEGADAVPAGTGTVDTDFGGFDDPTNMSPAVCVRQMRKYLKLLFLDLAEGRSDDLSAHFIEASEVFGPGSRNYRALIDIFSRQELSSAAALGNPKRAFRGAIPFIARACRA